MKSIGIIALLAVLTLGGCKKKEEPSAPSSAAAANTPHPAQASRVRAIQLYPELKRKGSVFNQAFLEIYEHRRKNDPLALTSADWPVDIAHRTASLLGEKVNQPAPIVDGARKPSGLTGESPLNKTAYDKKKAFVDTDRDGRAFDFSQPTR